MTPTLDAELLAAVSHAVEAQLGLHFPPERWGDLERGLHGAAAELGFDRMENCARALACGGFTRAQTDALAAHLTIGETYFFRDAAAFMTLTAHLVPALVAEKRSGAKRLRIWSAGCCTGEEPYSIAIALREALPNFAAWQITILATDINPRFLATAAAGVYGPWSFRGVPEATRHAWFHALPDGRCEVLPCIREMVTFAYVNLVEDGWPSHATETAGMDLIFCRNVLMYFSRERGKGVVARLRRALVAEGRLMVSTTETARELFEGFDPPELAGVALFRKSAPLALPPAPPVLAAPPQPEPAPERPRDHAADARRLADEGRLDSALAACDRALAANQLAPAHHYLRGVILQEQNQPEAAVVALRQALGLDAAFTLAHFTLGHLLLRQGRAAEAARCFTEARTLLHACAPEAVLPESEGLTAGRLLTMLATLEGTFA